MIQKIVKDYTETDLTMSEIGIKYGKSRGMIGYYLRKYLLKEQLKHHKTRRYAAVCGERHAAYGKTGQIGAANGMYGKPAHNRSGKDVGDGHGYLLTLKPDWYTGGKKGYYIFKHNAVLLEHLGLTELPTNTVVHHVDGDKLNNSILNLVLMDRQEHNNLHLKEHNYEC